MCVAMAVSQATAKVGGFCIGVNTGVARQQVKASFANGAVHVKPKKMVFLMEINAEYGYLIDNFLLGAEVGIGKAFGAVKYKKDVTAANVAVSGIGTQKQQIQLTAGIKVEWLPVEN
jgi:hypothetical protein